MSGYCFRVAGSRRTVWAEANIEEARAKGSIGAAKFRQLLIQIFNVLIIKKHMTVNGIAAIAGTRITPQMVLVRIIHLVQPFVIADVAG